MDNVVVSAECPAKFTSQTMGKVAFDGKTQNVSTMGVPSGLVSDQHGHHVCIVLAFALVGVNTPFCFVYSTWLICTNTCRPPTVIPLVLPPLPLPDVCAYTTSVYIQVTENSLALLRGRLNLAVNDYEMASGKVWLLLIHPCGCHCHCYLEHIHANHITHRYKRRRLLHTDTKTLLLL